MTNLRDYTNDLVEDVKKIRSMECEDGLVADTANDFYKDAIDDFMDNVKKLMGIE